MGLFDHESQGIIIGGRWLALDACQPFAPRFIGRFIERIGSSITDLDHNGVEAIPLVHVQEAGEFDLLAIHRKPFF